LKKSFAEFKRWSLAFLKWTGLALLVGAVCGLIGTAFHYSIHIAGEVREANSWLIYLLPVGGAAIVLIYSLMKQQITLGTDLLFHSIHGKKPVPFVMAPLIYLGTFITHLLGGSAGREGAALQLGGSMGSSIGVFLKLKKDESRTLALMGMGALFSALFGTPLAAALFVMEVLALGHMVYSSFVPCLIASFTAYGVSLLLGVSGESFALASVPAFGAVPLLQSAALAIACAILSVAFCKLMHLSHKLAAKYLKNPYLRAVLGGAVIVLMTLAVGTRDYNGAGGQVIKRAIEQGQARPWDFALKFIFTAITLASGFKGGEIVPTFFVGAAFGCTVGPIIGMDAGFAAALALIALFCGNTNCPIASILLALELFGGKGLPFFALACAITYMLSGNISLYHNQLIANKGLKLGSLILPESGEEPISK